MSAKPNYSDCRDICGNLASPGLAVDDARYVEFSARDTTEDQQRIEAEMEKLALAGRAILHVGVGNSSLARRFAASAAWIDGLTVSAAEKQRADALQIPNYAVFRANKYSHELRAALPRRYDLIVDNNLCSFACCKYHLFLMLDTYVWSLKPEGKILTEQRGMDWAFEDPGFIVSFEDIQSWEETFSLRADRLGDSVYALSRINRPPASNQPKTIYALRQVDGQTVVAHWAVPEPISQP